jgi:hypothetical protein
MVGTGSGLRDKTSTIRNTDSSKLIQYLSLVNRDAPDSKLAGYQDNPKPKHRISGEAGYPPGFSV